MSGTDQLGAHIAGVSGGAADPPSPSLAAVLVWFIASVLGESLAILLRTLYKTYSGHNRFHCRSQEPRVKHQPTNGR